MTATKSVNFDDEMQQNAFLFAEQASDRFIECNDIAYYIRKEMNKKYDHEWNCFVTNSNENPSELGKYKSYLCYQFRDFTIHLWYEPTDSEDCEQLQEQLATVDISNIKDLIAKYDRSGNGSLEFNEFLGFMHEGLGFESNSDQSFALQLRFLYDGMDMDGSHCLDEKEIIDCFSKWKQGDFKWSRC